MKLNEATVTSVIIHQLDPMRAPVTRREPGAVGRVMASNDTDPTIIRLEIGKPPDWLRRMEQLRGIIHNGPVEMELFRNHKGNWTWGQTLGEFSISI